MACTSNFRPWTAEEDALVRDFYPAGDLPALAKRLGRRPQAVRYRAGQLGVRRDPAVTKRLKKAYSDRTHEVLTRKAQRGYR